VVCNGPFLHMQIITPLVPGKYYHIYDRGNNRENIFLEHCNYHHFMKGYAKYIDPIADTFAYCLMRNHFHLLVRIKTETTKQTDAVFTGALQTTPILEKDASHAFNNLLNSYTKSINKAYNRVGSLFQKSFGRKEVTSDRYFITLIHYIHHNPQKHGFVEDFRTYPYSSYATFLSNKPTSLKRDEVLEWFNNAQGFEKFHREVMDTKPIKSLIADDDD